MYDYIMYDLRYARLSYIPTELKPTFSEDGVLSGKS